MQEREEVENHLDLSVEEEEARKEFEKANVKIVTEDEVFEALEFDGISVQADLDHGPEYTPPEWFLNTFLSLTTQRGDVVFFWPRVKKEHTLTMHFVQPFKGSLEQDFWSEAVILNTGISGQIATTFPDMCWYWADGTTPEDEIQVITLKREHADLGDLTRFIPGRCVDNFIEVMHAAGPTVLAGLMGECFVYGPCIQSKNNLKNLKN